VSEAPERRRAMIGSAPRFHAGFVREGKRRATLAISPFGELSGVERNDVAAEAERVLQFAAADAETRDVRFEAAVG
jgi:hypothetical protein